MLLGIKDSRAEVVDTLLYAVRFRKELLENVVAELGEDMAKSWEKELTRLRKTEELLKVMAGKFRKELRELIGNAEKICS